MYNISNTNTQVIMETLVFLSKFASRK